MFGCRGDPEVAKGEAALCRGVGSSVTLGFAVSEDGRFGNSRLLDDLYRYWIRAPKPAFWLPSRTQRYIHTTA